MKFEMNFFELKKRVADISISKLLERERKIYMYIDECVRFFKGIDDDDDGWQTAAVNSIL